MVKREEENFGSVANDMGEKCWVLVCWELIDDEGVGSARDVNKELLSKKNCVDVVNGAEL